jgi:hypothetical protein
MIETFEHCLKNIWAPIEVFWAMKNVVLVIGSTTILDWMTKCFQIARKCFIQQVEENLFTNYGDLKLVIKKFQHVIFFGKLSTSATLADQR